MRPAVSGTAFVRCANRAMIVEGVRSPYSLLAASDARYGERPAAGSDPAGAVGLARVLAEPARLHRRAGESARKAALR